MLKESYLAHDSSWFSDRLPSHHRKDNACVVEEVSEVDKFPESPELVVRRAGCLKRIAWLQGGGGPRPLSVDECAPEAVRLFEPEQDTCEYIAVVCSCCRAHSNSRRGTEIFEDRNAETPLATINLRRRVTLKFV